MTDAQRETTIFVRPSVGMVALLVAFALALVIGIVVFRAFVPSLQRVERSEIGRPVETETWSPEFAACVHTLRAEASSDERWASFDRCVDRLGLPRSRPAFAASEAGEPSRFSSSTLDLARASRREPDQAIAHSQSMRAMAAALITSNDDVAAHVGFAILDRIKACPAAAGVPSATLAYREAVRRSTLDMVDALARRRAQRSPACMPETIHQGAIRYLDQCLDEHPPCERFTFTEKPSARRRLWYSRDEYDRRINLRRGEHWAAEFLWWRDSVARLAASIDALCSTEPVR